jgi:hypothetical protein
VPCKYTFYNRRNSARLQEVLQVPYPIKLTYFKRNGKYYTEGAYWTAQESMLEVFADIRALMREGRLPGLVDGCKEFIVHVDASCHPIGYPALLIPEEEHS